MITGINHITLSVRDIDESFGFFVDILGFRPVMKSPRSVYLLAGNTWIALVADKNARRDKLSEYTHIAFTVAGEDFEAMSERILSFGASIWQENESEGASLYFVDPNGHKLEIHASDLETRLVAVRKEHREAIEFFDIK